MKRAGKFCIFIIILILILEAIPMIVLPLCKNNVGWIQSRNRRVVGIQTQKKNSIDVLVLGDSESYTSISPMQLYKEHGISSYVLGQPGQKIQATYYMLKTALKKQSPKVVLLETDVMLQDEDLVKSMQRSVAEAGNYYFPVFRYHNLWKPLLLRKPAPKKDFKGFVLYKGTHPYIGGDYMVKTTEKAPIPRITDPYMEKIIKLCKKSGAKLILYSAPSPKNYNYQRHNALVDYARTKKLSYVDLNLKDLGINWFKDTMDRGVHLNLAGAMKVTEYMGPYLKSEMKLPDRRLDAAYRNWNKEEKAYEEKVKQKPKPPYAGKREEGSHGKRNNITY